MDQVTSHTRKQRRQLRFLAREYVSPALNFLLKLDAKSNDKFSHNTSNWDSILQDLNAYETMQADNAVFKLETFIESYMASQTCSNISKIKTEDVVEALLVPKTPFKPKGYASDQMPRNQIYRANRALYSPE